MGLGSGHGHGVLRMWGGWVRWVSGLVALLDAPRGLAARYCSLHALSSCSTKRTLGPRKSATPAEVEMPAPVWTTVWRLVRSSATRASTLADSRSGGSGS